MKKISLFAIFFIAIFALFGCGGKVSVLSDVENIKYDGASIKWDQVDLASYYTISINDGNEIELTTNSYPYNASKQEFTVKITATGLAGKAKSNVATKHFIPLQTIEDIQIDTEGALYWDAIEIANGYKVLINGVESNTLLTAPRFELPVGKSSVQVKPVVTNDNSYYSVWSKSVSIEVLRAPNQISYDGEYISWQGILGAKSYDVYINGGEAISVTSNQMLYDSSNKDFNVVVKAVGNESSILSSKLSDKESFIYLETIKNLVVEDGSLKWDAVIGANGYQIKINGVIQKNALPNNLYDNLDENKAYSIEIKPLSSEKNYFSSWSTSKNVNIMSAPILEWNDALELDGVANNNITWNIVNGAQGYTVKLTKPTGEVEIFNTSNDQVSFGYAYLDTGVYEIQVKSNAGQRDNFFDSRFSKKIVVNRLAAPTQVKDNFITSNPNNISEGFTVSFTNVAGATGYQLYRDSELLSGLYTTKNQISVTNIIADSIIETQNFNYAIKSIGNTKTVNGIITATLDSLSSKDLNFVITVLEMPTSVDIQGYELKWESGAIQNGTVIHIDGAFYSSTSLSYNLEGLLAGDYDISVAARGNGAGVLASNFTTTKKIIRLASPTNIRISVDESEGTLKWEEVSFSKGYSVILDNSQNEIPADEVGNMSQHIKTTGTTVHMRASANYYNTDKTVYYMTSRASNTVQFIKLETPNFPEVTFNNSSLIWNAPGNINSSVYTPTYQVYNHNQEAYNGNKNGATMNINYLEGGAEYTFYVKAIGDGVRYINSEVSEAVSIYKLATPKLEIIDNKYVWSAVASATGYALYIDGVRSLNEIHVSGSTYSFSPRFENLKDYQVELFAIGDNGYTTIDSKPYAMVQKTKQLTTPEFIYYYDNPEMYSVTGNIVVEITTPSAYAKEYSYVIGGINITSSELVVSQNPNVTGIYRMSVFAVGGSFDEEGVYYLDSQTSGGNSNFELILLPSITQSSILVSQDGVVTWQSISNAIKYEIAVSYDDKDFVTHIITTARFELEKYQTVTIIIKPLGNGNKIISGPEVTITKNK